MVAVQPGFSLLPVLLLDAFLSTTLGFTFAPFVILSAAFAILACSNALGWMSEGCFPARICGVPSMVLEAPIASVDADPVERASVSPVACARLEA